LFRAVLPLDGEPVVGRIDAFKAVLQLLYAETESSDDLFNALFTVSAKLADEHRATCQLDTGSAYLADARLSKAFITMNCGPYRVVVLRNEFKGADGKSIAGYIVREELGQTDWSLRGGAIERLTSSQSICRSPKK